VPVKLPDGALAQVLLGSSDVVALRQVLNNLLPNPSAIEEASLGVRKAPFEVRYDAVVRGLAAKVVRVLQVQLLVGAALMHAPVQSRSPSLLGPTSLTDDGCSFAIATYGLAFVELAVGSLLNGRCGEGMLPEDERRNHRGDD
jgi:hypothetical protein